MRHPKPWHPCCLVEGGHPTKEENMRFILFFMTALSAAAVHAIGLQHGLFRSQSTQGPTWLGSAPIVKESYLITVYPDYLDIELDWEFGVGGSMPEVHRDALEIVGNINFEKGSSVIGMLVWYKDKILKAKLKTKDFARKQYEEVVDRNSPVPPSPRDPVLLEWIREDNYDISIFPVEWGGTRKLRIRYLVPSNGNRIGYPHAFSANAAVTLRLGSGVKGFRLALNNGNHLDYSASATLSQNDFELQAYGGYSGHPGISHILPSLRDSYAGSVMYLGDFIGNNFKGQMAHVFYSVPEGIAKAVSADSPEGLKIFATLRGGADTCRAAIAVPATGTSSGTSLRIYSHDPLEAKISWDLLKNGVLLMQEAEIPKVIRVEDGLNYSRGFGSVPFYPMSPTMPASLGISLGLIDKKYTLVALEEDALVDLLKVKFATGGVPVLNPEDMFPGKDERYDVALDAWLAQRGWDKNALLQPSQPIQLVSVLNNSPLPDGITFLVRNGRIHIRIEPSMLANGKAIHLSIIDLKGQIVREWNPREISTGFISWSPMESGRAAGTFILRISIGAKASSHSFQVR